MQLVDQRIEELARARTAEELTAKINAYSALQARFWTYSVANTLLIEAQLHTRGKTATQVAGYRAWIALNRVPLRGTGLAILAPTRMRRRPSGSGEKDAEQDEGDRWIVTGFRVVHVFDVTDTIVIAGKPDLYCAAQLQWGTVDGDYELLLGRLLCCARQKQISVQVQPLVPGLRGWSSGTRHIMLNAALSSGERCGTLLHELAHELCHDLERRRVAHKQAHGKARLEMEAEAAAYCLAGHLGVPRPDSAQYLALYGISAQDLRRSLESIRAVVGTVLQAVEGGMNGQSPEA
jgi:hypothetical protein